MLDQPLATSKMIGEKDGAIGRIRFNNPARHNAVSLEMWQGLAQLMEDYENEPAIRVTVLSGAGGKASVSGADMQETPGKRDSAQGAAPAGPPRPMVGVQWRARYHRPVFPSVAADVLPRFRPRSCILA